MGAIINYTFEDFKNAIIGKLNGDAKTNIETTENINRFKSIFDVAARTDNGENNQILETDSKGFSDLVKSTIEAFKNKFNKGEISLKQSEFISGNSKTKQSGALIPDRINEYENGELVKVTVGFDDDNNKQIEVAKGETWTELIAGDWRTKQNGALTPDKMNVYDFGTEIVETKEGFDDDNNGWIEGEEIW